MLLRELPDIGEEFLRRPALVKQDDEYDDNPAALFAFTAHGFDTDLTPFYSAATLKAAMQAAWDESRKRTLEDSAVIALAEKVEAESTDASEDRAYNWACDHIAAAIRAASGAGERTP